MKLNYVPHNIEIPSFIEKKNMFNVFNFILCSRILYFLLKAFALNFHFWQLR